MGNSRQYLLIPVALYMLLVSPFAYAKQWVPDSEGEVVLNYNPTPFAQQRAAQTLVLKKESSQQLLITASNLIQRSQLPGNSQLLSDAKRIIKHLSSNHLELNDKQKAQLDLAKANILQQSHHFQQARDLLNSIDQYSLYYPQALLIQSRTLLIQGNYDAAENVCRKLITHHIQAGELCTIEVKVYQRSHDISLPLSALSQRYKKTGSPLSRYFHQIQGTHLRIQKKYQEAEEVFSYDLFNAPSSQWYQWADMAFENQRPEKVYQALIALAETDNRQLEDGFIMRLARAEKAIEVTDSTYQKLARQRVRLRQHRDDKLHAADIAYYYLYVKRNSVEALKWAQINWQRAKEPSDKYLLEHAKAMHKK